MFDLDATDAGANPVRGQHQLPHPFSDDQHRPVLVPLVLPLPARRGEGHTRCNQGWEEAYYLWTKIFALTFAIGVVSGITMSFQFGTNWPGFMERAGNIAGPLLGYEVLTAFFLEATFLGIMLFGRNRVSDRVHLVATLMVAAGTTLSAFWILSLNSWMQTPHRLRDHRRQIPRDELA